MKVIDPAPPRATVAPEEKIARGDVQPPSSPALLKFESMPCGHISAFSKFIITGPPRIRHLPPTERLDVSFPWNRPMMEQRLPAAPPPEIKPPFDPVTSIADLLGSTRPADFATAELDDDGVVIFRNAAGRMVGACPKEAYDTILAAQPPVVPAVTGAVLFAEVFGLDGFVVPRRRTSALELMKARESDADERLDAAKGG